MRKRRLHRSFGQDIGPRWQQLRETEHAATYQRTEPGVGRCGDVTATLQCPKRPGKPQFGRGYSCMGQLDYANPYTGGRTTRPVRRIYARSFAVAVESAVLEADSEVERLRARCYPQPRYAPKYPGWSPVIEPWRLED